MSDWVETLKMKIYSSSSLGRSGYSEAFECGCS